MSLEDITPHLDEIEKQVALLKRIANPHSTEDEKNWNVGGLLHIVQRKAREANSIYWASRRDKKSKPAYWERMETKERDKKLAESRQEKKQWDKGAD